MNCKQCSTIGSCPFSFTDESEQVQNYGCLPTPLEIMSMRIHHGKTWACHDNDRKPCLGALEFLKEHNLDFKVIDKQLVTLDVDWGQYLNEDEIKKTYQMLKDARYKTTTPENLSL